LPAILSKRQKPPQLARGANGSSAVWIAAMKSSHHPSPILAHRDCTLALVTIVAAGVTARPAHANQNFIEAAFEFVNAPMLF
jgi:hypothetical protein